MSFEPPNYWSSVRHVNHYITRAECEWETQKSFHYPTVMVDWFHLNSANSPNERNLTQNRKKNTFGSLNSMKVPFHLEKTPLRCSLFKQHPIPLSPTSVTCNCTPYSSFFSWKIQRSANNFETQKGDDRSSKLFFYCSSKVEKKNNLIFS